MIIRLLDGEEPEKGPEGFLSLEPHCRGFALVVTNEDGEKVSAPYVLFLKPDPTSGRITLSLASSPNSEYTVVSEVNTIKLNKAS